MASSSDNQTSDSRPTGDRAGTSGGNINDGDIRDINESDIREGIDQLSSVTAIDRRIVVLHERAKRARPRRGAILPRYQADIDALLDLRLWLTGSIAS